MSKQVQLEKLDRFIKDGEIRFRTVKANIDLLDKEISTLSDLEIQLEENVKCLRTKRIIAIATEFKKSKDELAKTKLRMIALRNDRSRFSKTADEIELVVKKAKEDLEKVQEVGDGNVLQGKFGKKDNG